uniref:NADH-ubiquinone oxidoreductase chain 2 n=1 Tax=Cornu aspersum TaxID=6535 RepID=S4SA16_CORAP|nr:NADH dehydrogenase subunit 2 [Cornu aspersum]
MISYYWVMLLSVMIGCSVTNWFVVVFMMELLLFTVLFMSYEYKLLGQINSCVKYFLVQSVSSLLLLLGGIFCMYLYTMHFFPQSLFLWGLFLKLGVFPLHFWVIPVNKTLTYTLIGVIGSPLKILPLMMMFQYYHFYFSKYSFSSSWFLMLGVMSMVIGMMIGFLAVSLRIMLGASSIAHTGWFLFSIPGYVMVEYFLLYSAGLFLVISSMNFLRSPLSCLSLLCLSGLPPFSVFTGKLMVVYSYMASTNSLVFMILALLTSALSLFYYMKFSLAIYMFPNNVWSLNLSQSSLFLCNFAASCFWFMFF